MFASIFGNLNAVKCHAAICIVIMIFLDFAKPSSAGFSDYATKYLIISMVGGFSYLLTLKFLQKLYEANSALEEKVRLQSQLVRHEKMASIGMLASGIAHQLGNSINAIAVSRMSISKHLVSEPLARDKINKMLDNITVCCKRSEEIVHGLNFLAKKNIGQRQVFLNKIIDHASILASGSLLEHTRVVNTIPDSLSLFLYENSMIQVFMNLFANAADAGAAVIYLSSQKITQGLEIRVSDDGRGVAPEIKDRIFEAFFSTKGAEHGTGLGLAIVREELAKNSATIALVDGGVGTTFVITIRVRE